MVRRTRKRDAQTQRMRRALQAMQTLLALRRCVRMQCAPLVAAQMDLCLRLAGMGIVETMRRIEAAQGSAA